MNYRYIFLLPLLLILLLIGSCDSTPTQAEDDPEPEPYSQIRNPGTANEDFLMDERFDRLIVEIDYMPGMRPTDDALESLQDFLEKWLHKTEIIIQEPREIEAGGQQEYSANEIRELEAEHRSTFTDIENRTLTSYNIFVDGKFDQANVLGIAYYNTSNAYFGETIRQVSGSPPLSPSREKIESIVMRHEYGHLFGLVNSGTAMQEDHHDEENGAHCTENHCIMYYAVNTADFFANLFDGSIPDLDDFCEADVRAVQQ